MAHRLWTVKRTVLAGTIAFALASMARPAFAYDDGYQNVFSSVLTAVGVLPPDQSPEIDYRERPPLVVPPKASLVKPSDPGAGRTAAWPSDPDVIRRRKEAEDAKSPIALFEKNERPITKEQALKYRATTPNEDLDVSGCKAFEHSDGHCRVSPNELKSEEQRFRATNPDKSDAVTAGVEPERVYLTQPPKGYLKATKNVAATHEAPVKQHDESSPLATYVHPVETKSIDPLNN